MPVQYPQTKKVDQVDDYHGTKVKDPYRWLEDQDSPETAAWVAAQSALAAGELEKLELTEAFRKRLTELWDYEKFGVPTKEGGRYFYAHNDGLQSQSVTYTVDALDGEPRLLLDPNSWSEDGTVAMTFRAASRDGRYLAYGVADGGSDFNDFCVIDVDSGQTLDDRVKWSKFFSPTWDRDGRGFFYSGFGAPEGGEYALHEPTYFMKVYYHQLGTPQTDDVVVYERPDVGEFLLTSELSDDGDYLVMAILKGSDFNNGLAYKDLRDPSSDVVELLTEMDASYSFVGNDGPIFWIRTDLGAPNGKLVAIDTRAPDPSSWKELIPESDQVLSSVALVGGRFVASYLKDASSRVAVFDLQGRHERDVDLPGIGSAGGFGAGHADDPETFYVFTSFTYPPTVFRYDVSTGQSALWKRPKVDFDPAQFEIKQEFYESKDGTRVPMFIVHRRGLALDGTNPVYMTGYGGFGIPMAPGFSPSNLAWVERGGIYVVPSLRGGSEYGREWHLGGRLHNKQNVFDDFIAAGEWLIENKYTSAEHLAIGGGSNAGLLVGACMTQRPELFAAVHCYVGVLDMLRFDVFSIGWAWTGELGSKHDPAEFETMYAYSPLHNVKAGTSYPPTLVSTGDHDDRVWPAHSYKFAAALQEAQAGSAPILLRVATRAGHGGGKPTWMMIEELAESWAFLASHTKLSGVPA